MALRTPTRTSTPQRASTWRSMAPRSRTS